MIMRNLREEAEVRRLKNEMRDLYDKYEKQGNMLITEVITDAFCLLGQEDPREVMMKLRKYVHEVESACAKARRESDNRYMIPSNPFREEEGVE